MKITGEKILEAATNGRNLAGYHVSLAEGEEIKRDPRFQLLRQEQKRLILNLIDPV